MRPSIEAIGSSGQGGQLDSGSRLGGPDGPFRRGECRLGRSGRIGQGAMDIGRLTMTRCDISIHARSGSDTRSSENLARRGRLRSWRWSAGVAFYATTGVRPRDGTVRVGLVGMEVLRLPLVIVTARGGSRCWRLVTQTPSTQADAPVRAPLITNSGQARREYPRNPYAAPPKYLVTKARTWTHKSTPTSTRRSCQTEAYRTDDPS